MQEHMPMLGKTSNQTIYSIYCNKQNYEITNLLVIYCNAFNDLREKFNSNLKKINNWAFFGILDMVVHVSYHQESHVYCSG